MSKLNEYKLALKMALNKLLDQYKKRIPDESAHKHKHVTASDAAVIIGTGTTIGGVIGTAIPLPVVGTAIGGAVGIIISSGIVGILEADNVRKNKKIDNAIKVTDFFKEKENELLDKASNTIIDQRKDIIFNLKDTSKNKKSVAAYLAKNMMAAIKNNVDMNKDKLDVVIDGLPLLKSKQAFSHDLETYNRNRLTLKGVAKNRP